jgi:hypothetical protein
MEQVAAWWNGLLGEDRRTIYLRRDGDRHEVEARDAHCIRYWDFPDGAAALSWIATIARPGAARPYDRWRPASTGPDGDGWPGLNHARPGPAAALLPADEVGQLTGGRTVARWIFHPKDPHHWQTVSVAALPDGRFAVHPPVAYGVWIYPSQEAALAGATVLRDRVRVDGEWVAER